MGQEQRREQRLRSRGQVTIFGVGTLEVSATIYDMGRSGLGLLAECALPEGSRVRIESHGHIADGVIRQCRAKGELFHIGIDLADPSTED